MFSIRSPVLFFASLVVSALAFPIAQREVVDPQILTPTAGAVWTVGSTQTVSWNTSQLPPYNEQTNPVAKLILGYHTTDPDSENLMLGAPLASGFNISIGSIQIVVPNVPDGTLYILALMGDSGNITPDFTIQGGTAMGNPVSYMLSSTAAGPSYTPAPTNPPDTFVASTTPAPSSASGLVLQTALSSGASSSSSPAPAASAATSRASAPSSGASSSTSPAPSASTNAALSAKRLSTLVLLAAAGFAIAAMI